MNILQIVVIFNKSKCCKSFGKRPITNPDKRSTCKINTLIMTVYHNHTTNSAMHQIRDNAESKKLMHGAPSKIKWLYSKQRYNFPFFLKSINIYSIKYNLKIYSMMNLVILFWYCECWCFSL